MSDSPIWGASHSPSSSSSQSSGFTPLGSGTNSGSSSNQSSGFYSCKKFFIISYQGSLTPMYSCMNKVKKKGKGTHKPKPRAYPSFLSTRNALEYCYSPLYGILVHCRDTPPAVCHQYPFIYQRQSGVKFLLPWRQCNGRQKHLHTAVRTTIPVKVRVFLSKSEDKNKHKQQENKSLCPTRIN